MSADLRKLLADAPDNRVVFLPTREWKAALTAAVVPEDPELAEVLGDLQLGAHRAGKVAEVGITAWQARAVLDMAPQAAPVAAPAPAIAAEPVPIAAEPVPIAAEPVPVAAEPEAAE